jgi:hypothetical protein
MKEIHSKLPDETAVAVELRKEKERKEDKKDYGRSDQPAVNVTLSSDSDSDSDAPTVGRGGNSEDEFTPINLMLEEDAEGVIARTIRLSLSAAVAITDRQTRDEEVSVEKKKTKRSEKKRRSRWRGGCVRPRKKETRRSRQQSRWTARTMGLPQSRKMVKPTEKKWSLSQSGMDPTQI